MEATKLPRVYGLFSLAGRGKTTAALSGKGRKAYFEFDPGSFARAESGLEIEEGEVDIHYCHPPFDLDVFEDEGKMDTSMVGDSKLGPIKVVHDLNGYWDVIKEFRKDFAKAIQDPTISDVIFDTQTELWNLSQIAFQERVQHETNIDRTRIGQLEYEECNKQMKQYIMACKSQGKNLIMLAHEGEKYQGGKPTGVIKPDGWGKMVDFCDATLQFRLRDRKPYAVIFKLGGGDLGLIDMEIPNPSLERINAVMDAATFLRKHAKGVELPDEVDDILKEAAKLKFKLENE